MPCATERSTLVHKRGRNFRRNFSPNIVLDYFPTENFFRLQEIELFTDFYSRHRTECLICFRGAAILKRVTTKKLGIHCCFSFHSVWKAGRVEGWLESAVERTGTARGKSIFNTEIVEHLLSCLESERRHSKRVLLIFMHFYDDDTNLNNILFVEFSFECLQPRIVFPTRPLFSKHFAAAFRL